MKRSARFAIRIFQRLRAVVDRWRRARKARRNLVGPWRRVVSRRVARVSARRIGSAAPAARNRSRYRCPRQRPCDLSGAGAIGRGDEPVQMRLSRRPWFGLHARAEVRRRISDAHFRAAIARSHRSPCRGAGGQSVGPLVAAAGRRPRLRSRRAWPRPTPSDRTLCRRIARAHRAQQCRSRWRAAGSGCSARCRGAASY